MLKHLLQLAVGLSIIVLSVGMAMGVYEYQAEGSKGMLILSSIGIALWIPTIVLVVKYLNEEDD